VTGRLDIWSRTAQMVADHPLTGVGLGSFQAVYEPVYNPGLNSDLRRGGHAHNLWLQVAAEQGLVTALAYVALWIAVVSAAWRQRLGSWVQQAALLVVVAIAVRSLGDYMFFFTGGAPARLHTLMWLTWGIVCAEPSSAVKAR
jgi:O-antigen ligase